MPAAFGKRPLAAPGSLPKGANPTPQISPPKRSPITNASWPLWYGGQLPRERFLPCATWQHPLFTTRTPALCTRILAVSRVRSGPLESQASRKIGASYAQAVRNVNPSSVVCDYSESDQSGRYEERKCRQKTDGGSIHGGSPPSVARSGSQRVGAENLHVVATLEGGRLGHGAVAHASLHLADGRVLVLFHPGKQVGAQLRQVTNSVLQ